MDQIQGARIWVRGIVQGVGFRPFVYGLATGLGLNGWVKNTSAGVEIEIDGPAKKVHSFIKSLRDQAPPLAQIDEFRWEYRPVNGFTSFEILHSEAVPDSFQPISPDVSTCLDCLRELFDPADRRYLYPFINCTNCGPRFTIIEDIPYDRPNTTMAEFAMCPECHAEYTNPSDRRFHAQPIACPKCGPQIWLETDANSQTEDVIASTQTLLHQGKIVAIKGIGGFHLACDATNIDAVMTLRSRKLRVDKPFALMMPDIETIRAHCELSESERLLLESRARPIVILEKRQTSSIVQAVAPGQGTIGVMLPYTPLHYLLFSNSSSSTPDDKMTPALQALVMTSGNVSEEPIAFENHEARQRLAGMAEAFLMHNRPIRTRCDDSVMRVFSQKQDHAERSKESSTLIPVRRSRGYAPFPVLLPAGSPPVLAVGGELKNTFCITRERYAFLSHHIGDLENFETLTSLEASIAQYERLFRINPQAIAYDLHPDYMSTRYSLMRGEKEGIPTFGIQHHHAHIAACLAENGHVGNQPVIGISFDGTGYGEDGTIWGSEFLIADYTHSRRIAHLSYVPFPGGDKSAREPWRIALAWLYQAGIPWESHLPPLSYALSRSNPQYDLADILLHQLQTRLNTPLTSSMGRLFDAVAALIGIKQVVNYEAQAAIELESIADPSIDDSYPFEINSALQDQKTNLSEQDLEFTIDPSPIFREIIRDLDKGTSTAVLAARFQNSIAQMVLISSLAMRNSLAVSEIALSGGVWQNVKLLSRTLNLLNNEGFKVYLHSKVPCNDGGLALGQAAIVTRRLVG